jgi:tetratricopeptide (TPR) repeat protein
MSNLYKQDLLRHANDNYNMGEYEKAISYYRKVLNTDSDSKISLWCAQAYARLGDKLIDPNSRAAAAAYAQAAEYYGRAATLFGTSATREAADAYYNRAVCLEKRYRADDQTEALKAAVTAYTRYLEIGKALSPTLDDLEDVEKQIDTLNKRIASDE